MVPIDTSGRSGAEDADEEDDYLSMVIEEPTAIGKESSIQRAARKKREGELRSHQKTKQEKARDEQLAREAALAMDTLDASNKGYKMMAKLGYKPGGTLGKSTDARKEPIHLSMKEDRGGIGMDSEKKRKMREALEATEHAEKKTKVEQVGYRERLRMEREEARLEGQIRGAQKVTEGLDTEAEEEEKTDGEVVPVEKRPLRKINVLWRGLVKDRREKEANARMRKEVQDSLTYQRLDLNDSGDEEDDDAKVYNKKKDGVEFFEQDLDEEDEELDEFNELPLDEKLEKIVLYLRETHLYCFWCKMKYPDKGFLGCPGTTEEAHEM